jgi:hypothetical protein
MVELYLHSPIRLYDTVQILETSTNQPTKYQKHVQCSQFVGIYLSSVLGRSLCELTFICIIRIDDLCQLESII